MAVIFNQMIPKEVRNEIIRLASLINAPHNCLPGFEKSTYDGFYLAIDDQSNFIIIEQERGHAWVKERMTDLDEYLFWIFQDVTDSMALSYASSVLGYDAPHNDYIKLRYAKQERLLEKLNEEWAAKVRLVHQSYLEKTSRQSL